MYTKESIEKVINKLRERYKIGKYREEPFKVLITTILSQRTKDKATAVASESLFRKYTNAYALATAPLKKIERIIKPVGFYRQKSRRIKEIANILVDKYGGKVPMDFKALLSLPSVGRKTANCVLAYGFSIPTIPVDTHVHKIANRLGIVETSLPEETEKELRKKIPKKYWLSINELFVEFGK
ncbi:MAG: endonuclease III, partial [Candidatus Thermoplasmatota archaeon]